MKSILVSVALVTLLSGCVGTVLAVSNLAIGARSIYCEGTTDEGKKAVRAKLTEGQKMVACPE